MFCWLAVFCLNICVVLKTQTGSSSRPALFTYFEVVYNKHFPKIGKERTGSKMILLQSLF